MRRGLLMAIGLCFATSVALAAWLMPPGHEVPPSPFPEPHVRATWPLETERAEAARTDALHRAAVWMPGDPASADLASNPPDPSGTLSEPIVRCRYLDGPAHGTTAKFDCVLRDGEVVKVKYGNTGEIHAEIAASRLLTALGFGADRMFLVPRLRCYGCVRTPFYTNWLLDRLGAREWAENAIPNDRYSDFEWAGVERRFEGAVIQAGLHEGWAWFELEPIDPSLANGRAERDALRLAAMLLSHWDNKAANQRLVCLDAMPSTSAPSTAAPCRRPFALIHDLGATFGPNKVALAHWQQVSIWADRPRCMVSMRQFPYSGSTFSDTAISEAGRQLIARQLTALSEPQVEALFASARFREFAGEKDGDPRAWTAAFFDKVRQIASGPPCPPQLALASSSQPLLFEPAADRDRPPATTTAPSSRASTKRPDVPRG
jgi:hypothetical protein